MKVGDRLRMTPKMGTAFGQEVFAERLGPRDCTVVYIHPGGRFYVVEFTADLTGETWRQTCYFQNRLARTQKGAFV